MWRRYDGSYTIVGKRPAQCYGFGHGRRTIVEIGQTVTMDIHIL
jgi:hypothetical protein